MGRVALRGSGKWLQEGPETDTLTRDGGGWRGRGRSRVRSLMLADAEAHTARGVGRGGVNAPGWVSRRAQKSAARGCRAAEVGDGRRGRQLRMSLDIRTGGAHTRGQAGPAITHLCSQTRRVIVAAEWIMGRGGGLAARACPDPASKP